MSLRNRLRRWRAHGDALRGWNIEDKTHRGEQALSAITERRFRDLHAHGFDFALPHSTTLAGNEAVRLPVLQCKAERHPSAEGDHLGLFLDFRPHQPART
ncbi:hypothetical protein [Streptomyces albus]|uniref:hypothetical protein n=1 Tax=Streptomyces albus TaxID=1888 RepID=UPI0024AD9734|nr:hypothetical protein [Streptomyces albus]MDI6412704.1 hypothetical protein [Streptomyces albus]